MIWKRNWSETYSPSLLSFPEDSLKRKIKIEAAKNSQDKDFPNQPALSIPKFAIIQLSCYIYLI